MRVKIFRGCGVEKLQEAINEFIKDKCVISINQSESVDANRISWNLTITVLYDETGSTCGYLGYIGHRGALEELLDCRKS